MATISSTSNVELNDLIEQGTFSTTVSDWVGDKGKYFCEAASIASYYLKMVPTLYGHAASPFWATAETGLRDCKKILAFPGAIKGAMGLYEKLQKGGESVRNLLGDACYVIGDVIDGFKGMQSFDILTTPPAMVIGLCGRVENLTGVRLQDYHYAGFFAVLKDVTGVYGLGNTAWNMHVDIAKLKQIDLNKVTHKEIKDTKKATEYKTNWVNAEINTKWHDQLRCLSACAMCALGLAKTVIVAAGITTAATAAALPLFLPVVFVALGTIGVYGKYNMYASKATAGFWQNRYAELLPTQPKQTQLLKASK